MKMNSKTLKYILVGLVTLQVVALAGTLIINKNKGESVSSSDSGSSFASMLPIWVAIFVPLFASKKKKKPTTEQEKVKMFLLLIGLAVLVLFGMLAFFFTSLI